MPEPDGFLGDARAVGDAGAPISLKTTKGPALIGKSLWSRDIFSPRPY